MWQRAKSVASVGKRVKHDIRTGTHAPLTPLPKMYIVNVHGIALQYSHNPYSLYIYIEFHILLLLAHLSLLKQMIISQTHNGCEWERWRKGDRDRDSCASTIVHTWVISHPEWCFFSSSSFFIHSCFCSPVHTTLCYVNRFVLEIIEWGAISSWRKRRRKNDFFFSRCLRSDPCPCPCPHQFMCLFNLYLCENLCNKEECSALYKGAARGRAIIPF